MGIVSHRGRTSMVGDEEPRPYRRGLSPPQLLLCQELPSRRVPRAMLDQEAPSGTRSPAANSAAQDATHHEHELMTARCCCLADVSLNATYLCSPERSRLSYTA